MPTDLPTGFSSTRRRAVEPSESGEIRGFFQTLFLFYLGLGALYLAVLPAESPLGAFQCLSPPRAARSAAVAFCA